ncbi:MAG: hypothetical protein M1836_003033 [Candelina mexicana]|nr:MAG: hypothetical protein M1836_003033 [Candelina mexicana]
MAPPAVPGSPESSEDDSISLNSTVGSEELDEYPVEAILAEQPAEDGHDGELLYLAKWDEYPLGRSSWEPITSFHQDTLREWEDRKMRITRGYEKPFDVDKFEAAQLDIEQAQLDRRARRRAKKIKLGLPVSPLASASEENNETDEAEESPEAVLQSPPRVSSRRERQSPTDFIDDDDRFRSDGGEMRKRKRRRRVRSPEDSDAGLSGDSLVEEFKRKEAKKHLKRDKENEKARKEVQGAKDVPRPSRPRLTSPTSRAMPDRTITNTTSYNGTMGPGIGPSRVVHMGTAGRGPSRLKKQPPHKSRPKVQGAAIFGNWNAPKKARTRRVIEPGVSSGPNPRTFDKLSTKRRFEKAGRNEPAPNPDQLVFYDLKQGGKVVPTKVPVLSGGAVPAKTPHQLIMEQHAQSEGSTSNVLSSRVEERSEHATELGLTALPTSSESTKSKSDNITGQKADSLHGNNVSELLLDVSLAQTGLNSVTTEPSSIVSPSIPADCPTFPKHPQRSKPQSISFTVYAQRRASAQVSPHLGVPTKHAKSSPDQEDNVSTFTTDNMGNVNSGRVANEHPLVYFYFGNCKGKPAIVNIVGLDQAQEAHAFGSSAVSSQPLFMFDQVVAAEDYQAQYEIMNKSQDIATGDIVPRPESQESEETQKYLEDVVNTLKLHACGAVLFDVNLTIIIYPAKMDAWAFLDRYHHTPPKNTMLRFQVHPPISSKLVRTSKITRGIPKEEWIVTKFREYWGVSFEDLLPQNVKPVKFWKNVKNVFVHFPDTLDYQKEFDDVIAFLKASGATIYTNRTKGAWEKFAKKIESGTILLHPSFCYYHEIPKLCSVLRRNINVFHLGVDPNLGAGEQIVTLNRLFPHGRAILLTEDFFLNDPAAAKQLVLWFQEECKRKTPGTWKLVGRPSLREWLLYQAGEHGINSDLFAIYLAIDKMLHRSVIEEGTIDVPAPHAPIVCCDEKHPIQYSGDKQACGISDVDAEYVVSWFASWASMKAHEIRRFFIVDPNPKAEWRQWHTLEVCTPQEFAKRNY